MSHSKVNPRIHHISLTKPISEGIHPGLETLAPQKRLLTLISDFFLKIKNVFNIFQDFRKSKGMNVGVGVIKLQSSFYSVKRFPYFINISYMQ